MSLVNEALKRAKEAHDRQSGTPLRGAPLHTAAPPPPAAKTGIGALLALLLVVVAIIAGLGWYWLGQAKPPPAVTAQVPPAAPVAKPIAPVAAVAPPAPAADVPPPNLLPTNASVVIITPPPPAAPAPVNLQGIMYSSSRPAAIVNGRTVFVGDRVNGVRIATISPDRITVIWNNRSIEISMP